MPSPQILIKTGNIIYTIDVIIAGAIEEAILDVENDIKDNWPEVGEDEDELRTGAKNIIKAYLEQY
jgi:hypothetical protein